MSASRIGPGAAQPDLPSALTIWCNGHFNPAATRLLAEGTRNHRLVRAASAGASVLVAGQPDPAMAEADVVFGQPDPAGCLASTRLRWVELSSAGYTRYDTDTFRDEFLRRGAILTNASGAHADPCAQHALAMMLALGRELLPAYRTQLEDRAWLFEERRGSARLLTGETVVLLGFGSIGRRLAELLGPFHARIFAVRRRIHSEAGVRIVPEEELTRVLALADHVVDLLPENDTTRHYVNARRLACFKPGARFYNIGRGTTVDQEALLEALASGRLGAAYLDVTDPEPLPPDHPLWFAPRCFITAHAAGGWRGLHEEIVRHFLANLEAFGRGGELTDRIV